MATAEAGGYVFVSNMPGVMLAIGSASAISIKKATQHVHRKARENLRGGRTGKRYKKPGTNVYYTASAPGEFPAVQFGQLIGSVHWKVLPNGTGVVHTNVLHGAYLEDPKMTRPIGRRKWLKRTFDEEHTEVLEIIYGAGNPASRRWF